MQTNGKTSTTRALHQGQIRSIPCTRQQFWKAMLKQYDTMRVAESARSNSPPCLILLGHVEGIYDRLFLQTIPYQLENGNETIPDLSFDEAIICLEEQLIEKSKPQSMGDRMRNLMPDSDRMKAHIPHQLGRHSGQPSSSAASATTGTTSDNALWSTSLSLESKPAS